MSKPNPDDFMTIPKLARAIEIDGKELSDNTVRRYIKSYPQFFRSEIIEGWPQYEVRLSIPLIRRINEISAAGKRKPEVLAQLEQEFEIVEQEQEPEPKIEESGAPGEAGVFEFGPNSLAVLNRMADALEKIAAGMT